MSLNQVDHGRGEFEPPKLRRSDLEKLLELMDRLIVAADEYYTPERGYPNTGRSAKNKLHNDYTDLHIPNE